jgi:hypothetical protein
MQILKMQQIHIQVVIIKLSPYFKISKFDIEYGHYNDKHSTKFVKQFNNQSMHS